MEKSRRSNGHEIHWHNKDSSFIVVQKWKSIVNKEMNLALCVSLARCEYTLFVFFFFFFSGSLFSMADDDDLCAAPIRNENFYTETKKNRCTIRDCGTQCVYAHQTTERSKSTCVYLWKKKKKRLQNDYVGNRQTKLKRKESKRGEK